MKQILTVVGIVIGLPACGASHWSEPPPPDAERSMARSLVATSFRTCAHSDLGEVWCWGHGPEGDDPTPRRIVVDARRLPEPNSVPFVYVDDAGRWAAEPRAHVAVPERWTPGPGPGLVGADLQFCSTDDQTLTCVAPPFAIERTLPGVPTELAGEPCAVLVAGDFGLHRVSLVEALRLDSALGCPADVDRVLLSEAVREFVAWQGVYCAVVVSGDVACDSLGDERMRPRDGVVPSATVQLDGELDHVCSRTADGAVWCWGVTGLAERTGSSSPPAWDWPASQQIPLPAAATDLAVGRYHACVLLDDESVWCWGSNYRGQLGDGTGVDSALPVRVVGLP